MALPNEHPNPHDFEQLEIIYAHLDAALASLTKTSNNGNRNKIEIDLSEPKAWGQEIRQDSQGRANLFERDMGNGKKVITHVIWVDSIEGN